MLTPKQYAKENGISYYKSLKYYKKNNLPLEGSGGKNKTVVYNPFEKDCEYSQYWLGYIAADGNVSGKANIISIISKDVEHLMSYHNSIPGSHTFYRKGSGNTLIVYFANSEIKEFLLNLGITPKKSLTFKYIGNLTNHFIRGVFDGDGIISKGCPKITTGSLSFLNQLKELFDSLNFSYTVYEKGVKNVCYDIVIKGNSRFYFFLWLYKDSTIYLDRKFNKYVAYLKKFKYANGVNSGKTEMSILSQAIQECIEGATTNRILLEQ